MTYITATDVRRACGIPSSLMTDTTINSIITNVEAEMARWLNTKFVPTLTIDVLDGNGNEFIFTKKNPLLKVQALTVNDTTITPSSLYVDKSSGKIELTGDSETSIFSEKKKTVYIKYLYAMLDESSTTTSSSADITAGSAKQITVDDDLSADISENDYVEIYGMDGNREIAKVTAIDASSITVNSLTYAHESGSIIVLMQIPQHIKRYMEIEAGISVAINAVGATYTFNASYSLGDLQVTKGVPYTHWRESVEKLLKEREYRRNTIKPRPWVAI